jgi:hypothetical protein
VKDRVVLEATTDRFSKLSAIADERTKVAQFFSEAQTFCEFLIGKVIQADQPREDADLEQLKLQTLLYKATETSNSLSDQLKDEHYALARLTTKIFPDSPLPDDSQFVAKEVKRFEIAFDENSRLVTDLRSKSLIIDSVLAQFATKHNLRFSGDGVSDVKTVTSHATATIQGLERIATALSLASSDADLIAVSVRKLRRENEELNTELDSVARLSAELERCKDRLADAEAEQFTARQPRPKRPQISRHAAQL